MWISKIGKRKKHGLSGRMKEEETYERNTKQLEINMLESEEKKKITLRVIQ